jgi:hypothetical protein
MGTRGTVIEEKAAAIAYIEGDIVKSAFKTYSYLQDNNIFYLEVEIRNTYQVGEDVYYTVYQTRNRCNETHYISTEQLPFIPISINNSLELLRMLADFTPRELQQIESFQSMMRNEQQE